MAKSDYEHGVAVVVRATPDLAWRYIRDLYWPDVRSRGDSHTPTFDANTRTLTYQGGYGPGHQEIAVRVAEELRH